MADLLVGLKLTVRLGPWSQAPFHSGSLAASVRAILDTCGSRQAPRSVARRRRDHPHLTRQYRAQLLQSVAFTPGTGKAHLSIGLGIRACQAGHRVAFATAAEWVGRLAESHHAGKLLD